MEIFNPQNLANTMYAYAVIKHRLSNDFIVRMEDAILNCVTEFCPQNVGNTLWAYATLELTPSKKVQWGLAAEMVAKRDKFKPQVRPNAGRWPERPARSHEGNTIVLLRHARPPARQPDRQTDR